MLKPEYWKMIAIMVPIAFLCNGCFTYISSLPEERLPEDDPPPVQPPPVIIIENHYYPPIPAQDPPPPEPKRPFDRHDPGDAKGEVNSPRTESRATHEEKNPYGESQVERSEGRSPRR